MMKKTYSKERMTNLSAVLSLVQSALYLAFVLHFLEIFMNKSKVPLERHRIILHHLTATVSRVFLGSLFVAGALHLTWFCSSIYVLLGNRNGNERSVSQYLAVTSLVNILDIIFPFVVLPTTFTVFGMSLDPQAINQERLGEPIRIKEEDFGTYFWLLMTFIRGGCFTFAIDMFSALMAYQRFMELHGMRVRSRVNSRFEDRGKHMFQRVSQSDMDHPKTCVDIPMRDKIRFRMEKEIPDSPVLRPLSKEEQDEMSPTFIRQESEGDASNETATVTQNEEDNAANDSPKAEESDAKMPPRVLNGVKKADVKTEKHNTDL